MTGRHMFCMKYLKERKTKCEGYRKNVDNLINSEEGKGRILCEKSERKENKKCEECRKNVGNLIDS